MRIQTDRIQHMHGVAEYMYEHAEDYGLNKDRMYVLGLLHDIGYVNRKEEHEVNGARLLQKVGYVDINAVSWHGSALYDAERLMGHEIPAELRLLVEADLKVDLGGELVGYEKRLEGVAERHGIESIAYRICRENVEWLNEHNKQIITDDA